MCRIVSARSLEQSARKVTNIFMDVVVYVSQQILNEPRLVIDHEQHIEPTNGPLDYVYYSPKRRSIGMGS
jgi:hypothetical protein